jgi:hypothetical protein
MEPLRLVAALWIVVAAGRFAWFASRAAYLYLVRRGLDDYHRAVADRRSSSWEKWLRSQRRRVATLIYESGQYEDGPDPASGGRATKLNVYALESLEHWLSEHPQGMTRARTSLSRAIRLYAVRALKGLNPFFWIEWLLFFPRKVAARIGVAGDPEWTDSLRLLYWTALVAGLVVFFIFFVRR